MKISTKMIKGVLGLIGVLFLLAPLTVFAQDGFYVIPVAMNKPLKNVITVAKANGKFTDPVAAVNSITDASASNPYLVVIAPGVYTITSTLQMKPYVDIVGSGENVTKIMGAINTGDTDTSVIIKGANNSSLSSLTVEHTGGGISSAAIHNSSASPMITNVTAKASGSIVNFGVYNLSSSPVMTHVTATGSGGTNSRGVYNLSSSPTMTHVTATASGGSGNNYGVYNYIFSNPKIRRSTMDGSTDGLYTSSNSTSTISQSTIIGGASVGTGGTNNCVACDKGDGTATNATCN